MNLQFLKVGPVACNCCLVACPTTAEAVVIDPGGNPERILAALKVMKVRVRYLLHTHAHFDHILATGPVARATGASILLHEADRELYENLSAQGIIYGFEAPNPPAPTRWLVDGEVISVGSLSFRVLHTPGHSPGSVSFFVAAPQPVLFAGDTLFLEAIGRTDSHAGSRVAITRSIREKLYPLPPETRVIPGHGDETTIGHERAHNPFVRVN